jgi:LytS/YehU family sensor histidine kinase
MIRTNQTTVATMTERLLLAGILGTLTGGVVGMVPGVVSAFFVGGQGLILFILVGLVNGLLAGILTAVNVRPRRVQIACGILSLLITPSVMVGISLYHKKEIDPLQLIQPEVLITQAITIGIGVFVAFAVEAVCKVGFSQLMTTHLTNDE